MLMVNLLLILMILEHILYLLANYNQSIPDLKYPFKEKRSKETNSIIFIFIIIFLIYFYIYSHSFNYNI